MAYQWMTPGIELDDAERAELGLDESFDDREAAEAWCGLNWPLLADAGVEVVTLTDNGEPVYTMDLDE